MALYTVCVQKELSLAEAYNMIKEETTNIDHLLNAISLNESMNLFVINEKEAKKTLWEKIKDLWNKFVEWFKRMWDKITSIFKKREDQEKEIREYKNNKLKNSSSKNESEDEKEIKYVKDIDEIKEYVYLRRRVHAIFNLIYDLDVPTPNLSSGIFSFDTKKLEPIRSEIKKFEDYEEYMREEDDIENRFIKKNVILSKSELNYFLDSTISSFYPKIKDAKGRCQGLMKIIEKINMKFDKIFKANDYSDNTAISEYINSYTQIISESLRTVAKLSSYLQNLENTQTQCLKQIIDKYS